MTSPKAPKPDQIDKERRVIELRRAGATYDDIAQAVGYADASGARNAYIRAMKRTLVEAGTEEIRELELDRLDRMQRAIWAKAMKGDVQAIHTALKILDRRARYLGLDAPMKQEITIENADGAMIDREVARLVEMLEKTNGTTS